MNKKDIHANIVERVKSLLLVEVTAEKMNELRSSKDGFTLIIGGFSFLGEGSGPYANGDDKDPERRAEVVGELQYAGWVSDLKDAEEAGEAAIGTLGHFGIHGDNSAIPAAANMRIIEG